MIRSRHWGITACAAAILMMAGMAFPAYAETAVSSVRITFENQYDEEGGRILEPKVESGGNDYALSEVSWSQEPSGWSPGQEVTASILLAPEEGRYFSPIYADERIAVSGAQYRSARREEDGRLLVKANYYPVVKLGKTASAGWSDAARTRARWEAVPYATAYQLRLYREGGEYVTTLTLGGTSVDLESYMTGGGKYYYEVRAISGSGDGSAYRKNGEYVTSGDAVSGTSRPARGVWSHSEAGWRYTDENGRAATEGWRYIAGTWYYFDSAGYALSGWQQISGKWYYMDEDCRMQTGWLELDGKTYYLASTGEMITGWHQMSPSNWYYFYEDGTMAVSTVIDGYRIGADGKWR